MEVIPKVAIAHLLSVKEGDFEEFRYQHKNCRRKDSNDLKNILNVLLYLV